jgi:hypothetical protein
MRECALRSTDSGVRRDADCCSSEMRSLATQCVCLARCGLNCHEAIAARRAPQAESGALACARLVDAMVMLREYMNRGIDMANRK